MKNERLNAFTSYQRSSKAIQDTTANLLDDYRNIPIEELPSYSKSEVDLENSSALYPSALEDRQNEGV